MSRVGTPLIGSVVRGMRLCILPGEALVYLSDQRRVWDANISRLQWITTQGDGEHLLGLALHPKLPAGLQARLTAILNQLGNGVDLGPDEAAREVRMNEADTLWCQGDLARRARPQAWQEFLDYPEAASSRWIWFCRGCPSPQAWSNPSASASPATSPVGENHPGGDLGCRDLHGVLAECLDQAGQQTAAGLAGSGEKAYQLAQRRCRAVLLERPGRLGERARVPLA